MLLILIFCGFPYLQIHLHVHVWNCKIDKVAVRKSGKQVAQRVKKLEPLMHTLPAEDEQGSALPSQFSSYTVNKYPFKSI